MKKAPEPKFIIGIVILTILISCKSNAQTENWTHFRGSNLNGISDATNLPIIWNDSTNIAWKTSVHGKGWSSPVVFGNQIWLTTAEEDGSAMFAICIDKNTGNTIFNVELLRPDSVFSKHAVNTFATPTPCIEEGFVYIHFGTYGTFCLNTSDASLVWKRTDLNCNHVQGPGSSPIIYKNMLILHLEGNDVQYITALDKKTGKTIWKTNRPKECYDRLEPIGKKAYITPIVIRLKGKDVLISNGSAVCIAYDIETGKEIWRIVQGVDSTISSPVYENGTLFFYTSFVSPPNEEKYTELFAVNPDGEGDISKTHILWRIKSPILQLLTPVVKDGLVYTVDTRGNMMCINAETGEKIWSEKRKGNFHSSPIYADGKIYFSSHHGITTLVKEGRVLEIEAENKLDGEIWATPAVLDKSIIMRTSKYLYMIRN
jgi:outer membrane protein assembly factor BamB